MKGYKIPKGFVQGYRNAIEQYPKDSQYAWGMNAVVEALEVYPLEELDETPWHTGTPTEKGLYVVLTKASTDGVSSSEGTYILDYWDGYSFKYLERRAMISALTEPDKYSWVAWQKINPYKDKEDGRTD